MANFWKTLAENKGIDVSGISDSAAAHEATWIAKLGGSSGGGSLKNAMQNEVANMPNQESLVGLWFLGYDVVANEGDANNQRVFDWSGNGNHGWRGNSTTPNTSSPEGTSFDGTADFVQIPYAANMNTATTGSVTLGSVAAQSVAATAFPVSQNDTNRALYYISDGRVFGYFSRYRIAASNRVLNTSAHYMSTGNGSNVNMYKNGVLSNVSTSSTYNADEAGQPLYIGRRAAGNYFAGTIHCVYLYTSDQSANAALINTTINNILAELGGQ